MRCFLLGAAILFTFLSIIPHVSANDGGRERIRLDTGWKFNKGEVEGYSAAPEITHWRWKFAMKHAPLGDTPADPSLSTDGPEWADAAQGEDVFKQKTGSAWYRVVLPKASGTSQSVSFHSVDDNATVYLNGKKLTYHEGWNDPFTVSLGNAWNADGPNVLAVLVYNGAGAGGIGETHFKSGDQDVSIKVWRWRGVPEPDMKDLDMSGLKEDPSGTAWKDAVADQDVFSNSKGFAWFRADLPEIAVEGRVLQFDAVDDIATIYLNGKKLLHHEGWNEPFSVPLDQAWNKKGPNRLAVLVENTFGGGYIKRVTLEYSGLKPTGPALPDFNDSAWRQVHLPHDFVVEGAFDPHADKSHGYLPAGIGWYRKTFTLPASDKGRDLWIDFDGVYRNSRVWLNGKELGRHASGYTSFRFDISDAVVYGGDNVLVVRVDATVSEGWWYEGGGIYRHVWLNKTAPLHVAPLGVYVTAQPDQEIEPSSAEIQVRTRLDCLNNRPVSCRLVSEVVDPTGKSVLTFSDDGKVTTAGHQVFIQKGRLEKPALWSLEKPNLYRLVTRVEQNGRMVDQTTTVFGVRTIRFDKDLGFFLNGKSVKIKGTCNHQDFAGVGIAMGDRLHTYRLERLKSMGSNAYRCSHNPVAPELLDECDRLGILVMDENRRLGDNEEILGQVRDMVLRDRNHPSVILWSLCNEEQLQGTTLGAARGEAMKKVILDLDKTRLITCAMNGGYGEGLSNVVELQGFNYHVGDYEPFHQAHPDMPLFGSETASTVCTRGIYKVDKPKGYVTAYDVFAPEWAQTTSVAWKALAEKPYMAGGFVWTGFDYRGEPTPYEWPCISSHFGILDTCGFPKDNYWYYKAWWGSEPVLHLLPHWNNPGRVEETIDVWAHSNCDQVELFLNGKSQGRKDVTKFEHVEWKVPYHPGVLLAKGYRDGKVILMDKVATTGQPAALRLEPYVTSFKADGEDQVPVAVSVVDAQGRVVPTASNLVLFSVSGPAVIDGVGNGDPSCHEPDKATKRSAFNGYCMAVLRAGEKTGAVTLTARSKGLKPATILLKTRD